jgi:hypothetical protein
MNIILMMKSPQIASMMIQIVVLDAPNVIKILLTLYMGYYPLIKCVEDAVIKWVIIRWKNIPKINFMFLVIRLINPRLIISLMKLKNIILCAIKLANIVIKLEIVKIILALLAKLIIYL